MKKSIILCFIGLLLLSGCVKTTNSFEELSPSERLKYDLSIKDNLEFINTYAFSKTLCLNIDVPLLRKTYIDYLADQLNIDKKDLTDNDFKYFFINGISQNGLFGDKKTKKMYTESEMKQHFRYMRYNNKLAMYSQEDKLFMFNNEEDCYRFLKK